MLSLRQFAVLAVAAGSMAAANAQVGDSDAARRMRNREEAIARYQQMQRAGTSGTPPAAMPDGPRMHDHRRRHGHHRPHYPG